jgi:hypothetical protein
MIQREKEGTKMDRLEALRVLLNSLNPVIIKGLKNLVLDESNWLLVSSKVELQTQSERLLRR